MSICAFIGDSIALGLSMVHPGCYVNAVVGRNPVEISQQHVPGIPEWGVISSGSNQPDPRTIRADLYKTRKNLHAQKVVWVLPQNWTGYNAVRLVSVVFGDQIVYFKPGKDGIHPKSYQRLWKDIQSKL